MNKRIGNTLNVVSFASGVGIVMASSLYQFVEQGGSEKFETCLQKGWQKGVCSQAIEKHFDQHLSVRSWSVSSMAALRYALFEEVSTEVVVGKDRWFFTSEEFSIPESHSQSFDENMTFIAQVDVHLKTRGVDLVVVPVPAKARLLSHKLEAEIHESRAQLYAAMFDRLQAHGVHVVDTLASMQAHSEPESLFFKTDTHWTPAGASLVAEHLASYCESQNLLADESSSFVTEIESEVSFQGDLMNFLPADDWFSVLGLQQEVAPQLVTYEEGADLFSSSVVETALVGTSYSADEKWNFDGALKQALSQDLINYASEGEGPFVPMQKLLQAEAALEGIDLVIWEIPERYLFEHYVALEVPAPGLEGRYVAAKDNFNF